MMREELDAMNGEVAVLRTQSQAHMIKYKAELLGRCDAIDAENAEFRVNLEGQEGRLNCLENAMPDAEWQEGALSAGINFNKTTIILAANDIKALSARLSKSEECAKKAAEAVTKFERTVLDLDSTVGDVVGSMGTLFEDTDELSTAVDTLKAAMDGGASMSPREPISPRSVKKKEEDKAGSLRVRETMEGCIKQAAWNKQAGETLANQFHVLEMTVTHHNKSILEHATNMVI